MTENGEVRSTEEVLAGGARLVYRVDGPADGPTLVFSNSLGLDMRMWQQQVDFFAQRFRVIRYDSRGHGRSEAPSGAYTLDRLGNDLLTVLDAGGVERTHICGLSLGGMVALWLAIYHPERVERAIFANTASRIGTEASWDDRIARVQAGGLPAIREMVVNRFLSAPFRQRHPETAEQISALLVATNPMGYIGSCEALRVADLRTVVGTIQVSSLILAGALDEATPPTQSEELHAAISGSALSIIPACAHLSNVEAAAAFNMHVMDFLSAPQQ